MSNLYKKTIRSNCHQAAEKEVAHLFAEIGISQNEDAETFDLTGEITSVLNMRVWRILSQSGYNVRYSHPTGQDFELHFIESGRYMFRSSGSEIEAPANSAVLLKNTSRVELFASPDSEKVSVLVPSNYISSPFGSDFGAPGRKLTNFRSHTELSAEGIDLIRQMARLLVGDSSQAHPFAQAPNGAFHLANALVETFVGFWPRIDTLMTEAPNLPRHLQRAIEWLDTHAGENIPIKQLARLSGASTRTLQNSFRQHLSTNPNAYIQRIRLGRIHHELSSGDTGQTIEQIAARWGFSHMGYFASRYRSIYGESPSSTRQKWKKAQS